MPSLPELNESQLDPRRAAGALIGRHAIGFAINFIGVIFIARTIGPVGWGVFSAAYVAQLIMLGLIERGLVGYLIQHRGTPDRIALGVALSAGLLLATAGAMLAVVLAAPAARVYGDPALELLLISVGLSLFAYAIRAIPLGLLERSLAYGRVGLVEVTDLAVFNGLAVAGLLGGLGMMALVIASVGRAVASMAVALTLTRSRPVVAWSWPAVQELWRFAGPYSAANAVSYLNGAAAPVLVGTLAGPRELGILQLAYALIAYPQILNAILGRIAFPFYARLGDDPARLRAAVATATAQLLTVVGGATIVFALSSPLWVSPVYGPEWASASAIMIVIAPALAIGTSMTFISAALNAAGRTTDVLRMSAAFAAIYWIAAVLLVPTVGSLGLPLAYVLASSAFIGQVAAYRKHVGEIAIREVLIRHLGLSLLGLLLALLLVLRPDPSLLAATITVATIWAVRSVSLAGVPVVTWGRAFLRSADPR